MPKDELEKTSAYAGAVETWKHFTSWREKIFAGYFTVLAGLGVGFGNTDSILMRIGILAAGLFLSGVFWVLDYRNRLLIGISQRAAAELEHRDGAFRALTAIRNVTSFTVTHGLAVNSVVGAVSAFCIAGLIYYHPSDAAPDIGLLGIGASVGFAAAFVVVTHSLGKGQRVSELDHMRALKEGDPQPRVDAGSGSPVP